VQAVPLDRRAWHAGDGEMANSDGEMCNPNYFSIGIEIANYGLLQYNDNQWYYEIGGVIHEYNAAKYGMPVRGRISYDTGKSIEGWWETYKTPQLSSVRKLVQRLVRLFDIPLNRVVGHQDIALPPGKKKDPGPLFPWRILKNMDGPVGDGTNHIRTQTELLDEI
jgi:N-acetyl-anhydromuramyl-L-alanine amidase AmpD